MHIIYSNLKNIFLFNFFNYGFDNDCGNFFGDGYYYGDKFYDAIGNEGNGYIYGYGDSDGNGFGCDFFLDDNLGRGSVKENNLLFGED